MIWEGKYKPWEPEIICPVCEEKMERTEWIDYGMHYACTEYYKRYLRYNTSINYEMKKDVTKTMINEI